MRTARAAILVMVATGCDNADECAALRDLHYEHQRALAIGRARAGLAKKTKAQAERAETQTKALLAKYGLDMAEDDITAALKARVETVPGAALARSVRPMPGDDPSKPTRNEVLWSITMPTKSFREAAGLAKDLAAIPPLLELSTLLPRDGRWVLELVRVAVDRLPIAFKPQPLPIPKDPSTVPSRLGFCGADELRAKIEAARQELETLKVAAAQATVHLPTKASWEGLRLRAQVAVELESEARRLFEVFTDAAAKAKVKVKAIGQQSDLVILEIYGGAKARGRVERNLPEDVLQSVKYGEQKPGTVRFTVANRVAERARRPDRREAPQGIDLGLPKPDELKRQFDAARKKMLQEQRNRRQP